MVENKYGFAIVRRKFCFRFFFQGELNEVTLIRRSDINTIHFNLRAPYSWIKLNTPEKYTECVDN